MEPKGGKQKFAVRTFHNDLQQAEGAPVAKEPTPPAPKTAAENALTPLPTSGVNPPPPTKATAPITRQETQTTPTPDPFAKKESKLQANASELNIDDAQALGEGTIVKETKRKRWSLGRAIGKSLTDWADEKKEHIEKALEEKKDPKPTVAPSETRKEVIQKAESQSHIAPQDDHRVVIKKLRTLAEDAEEVTGQPFTIKKPKQNEKPKWESARETHTPAPAPQPSARLAPSMRAEAPAHVVPDVLPQVTPASRDIEFEVPSFDAPKATNVRTFRNDAIDRVENNNLSVPNIAAAEARRRATAEPPKALPLLARLPLTQVMVGLVVLLAVGGGSYVAFQFFAPSQTSIETADPIFTFFENIRQEPVVGFDTVEALLDALAEKQKIVGGITGSVIQYYPATETEDGLVPITGTEFMTLITPRAASSFVRGINEEMMYGVYSGERRAPFLILTNDTFDTAFAGMLGWEGNMVEDLAPIFGTETEGLFTDDVVENTDVRVRYDRLGDTQIVYGFINQRVLLITSTMPAFGTLLRQLRSRGL